MRRLNVAAASVGLFVAIACDRGVPSPLTFDQVFPEHSRIELEEDPADPIIGLTALSVGPSGRLVVTDQAASRVRVYSPSGELITALGREGDGPGELKGPTWAAEGPLGEIRVVEQGSPRVTTYWPGDSISVSALPGHYGSWIAPISGQWVAGAATRTERFAVLERDPAVAFGGPPPEVNSTPFWIFFAKDRAGHVGDGLWVNSSFVPEVRVFDLDGVQARELRVESDRWVNPTAPPVDRIDQPGDRERIEEWATGFTVVAGLAGLTDSLAVVQFGRHAPAPNEPYYVRPEWVDVYDAEGTMVIEGLDLEHRILSGGDHLYLLVAEPPSPWTLSVRSPRP